MHWLWWLVIVFLVFCGICGILILIGHIQEKTKAKRDPEFAEELKKRAQLAEEQSEKLKAGLDPRVEEHKSYIDDDTGEIFLRSAGFHPDKKSNVLSDSEEWVISNNSVNINKMKQGRKTIPLSQLSGVKLEYPKHGKGCLNLYIGGGRTSQTFWGTGGMSGLPNHHLFFDAHDAEIARKAHDYIAAQIAQ